MTLTELRCHDAGRPPNTSEEAPVQSNAGRPTSVQDVALIVGGGPGISSSCARLFAESGMRVGVAARKCRKSSS